MHTYTLTNVPTKYQPSTSYGIQEIVQTRFLKLSHYDKVKSRSHHDIAHLHNLTNVPTKYQPPIPYGFPDIARQNFQTNSHCGRVKGQIKVTP